MVTLLWVVGLQVGLRLVLEDLLEKFRMMCGFYRAYDLDRLLEGHRG